MQLLEMPYKAAAEATGKSLLVCRPEAVATC